MPSIVGLDPRAGPRRDAEPLERGENVCARRRELQSVRRGRRSAAAIGELLREHLGGLEREVGSPVGVEPLLRERRVELRQLGEELRALAQGHEACRDLGIGRGGLARAPVQPPGGLIVFAGLRERCRPLPGHRGGGEVAEPCLVEVAQLVEPGDLLARVVRHFGAAAQDGAREVRVAEALGRVVDRVEVLRPQVGVLEKPGALRPGARLVPAVGGDLRQACAQRSGKVPLGSPEARLEQIAQVFPALGLRIEIREGRVRVGVVGVVLDRAAVRRRRGGHVAQVVPLDGPDPVDELFPA